MLKKIAIAVAIGHWTLIVCGLFAPVSYLYTIYFVEMVVACKENFLR